MTWWDELDEEIEDAFARCEGVFAYGDLLHSYHHDEEGDHAKALSDMRYREVHDVEWRKRVSRQRESKRKLRMQADPKYAAKRKAQLRRAYERRKKRHKRRMKSDPEYAERMRARWRSRKREAQQ